MTEHRDVVVIGAGHNGLIAAWRLARAGRRVLVLERRDRPGGAAASEELFPGHRVATVADAAPRLRAGLARELGLAKRGLRLRPLEPLSVSPRPGGPPLVIHADPHRTAAGLPDRADADAYAAFVDEVAAVARVVGPVLAAPPPDVFGSDVRDLFRLAAAAGRARRRGRRTVHELTRWATSSVADVAEAWFRDELLRAAVCARGVAHITWGPGAAGTAATLVLQAIDDPGGVFGPGGVVVGGMGAFAHAIAEAASSSGAEVRTGCDVRRLLTDADGRVAGVELSDGSEVRAPTVLSNADPTTTLLGLAPAGQLDPAFVHDVRAIKYRGSVARVHLRLRTLPRLAGSDDPSLLRGWIRWAPTVRAIERAYDDAKYGEPSREPTFEVRFPGLADPSVVPAGEHHASVTVRYAPFHLASGTWDARRDALADTVVEQLERFLPGVADAVTDRHVITPADLERRYGLPEGNPNHGEHTLDQLLHLRPVPGWDRSRMPVPGLFLCGAGAHPGGGLTGAPGLLAAAAALANAPAD